MGRKCMKEGKKRSTHLHIRMTIQERGTLERVSDYLNKNATDIVLEALYQYYERTLNDIEYDHIVIGEEE